jgi:Tfp pilus assembly protein PilN
MRAVNLIPADLRRGGGAGAGGRTGGAVYVLVAALVGLVAMALAYGVTTHRITERKTQIATAVREAQVAEARAAALQPYVEVQTRRASRVALVQQLANKRFDWSIAMKHVAEVLPRDVMLSKLVGNISPGAAAGGAGGAGGLRNAIPVPALDLSGCTPSQPRTAAALDSLRKIPGVTVVSLGSSVKTGVGAPAAAASGGACHGGPTFEAVVFYTDPTAPHAPGQAGATATALLPVASGPTGTTGAVR